MGGETCIDAAGGGEFCGCFPGRITYTVDASGTTWPDTINVSVTLTPNYSYGASGSSSSILLYAAMPSDTASFAGQCTPSVQVRRHYSMRGGVSCTYTDTVTRTSIVIPMATLSGATCTAPPL